MPYYIPGGMKRGVNLGGGYMVRMGNNNGG